MTFKGLFIAFASTQLMQTVEMDNLSQFACIS